MKCQRHQPEREKNQRKRARVVVKEKFPDHPDAVRRNPKTHGKIVDEFLAMPPRLVSQPGGHAHRRHNHGHPQQAIILNPASVFEYPEQDVEIFNASDEAGFRINGFDHE